MKTIMNKNKKVRIIILDAEGDWEDIIVGRCIPFWQARIHLVEMKRRYAKYLHNSSLFTCGDRYEYCIASCQNDRYEARIISARKR